MPDDNVKSKNASGYKVVHGGDFTRRPVMATRSSVNFAPGSFVCTQGGKRERVCVYVYVRVIMGRNEGGNDRKFPRRGKARAEG